MPGLLLFHGLFDFFIFLRVLSITHYHLFFETWDNRGLTIVQLFFQISNLRLWLSLQGCQPYLQRIIGFL
jgi:hypothetical protein